MSNISKDKYQELVSRFTNHVPDNETIEKMANMRKLVRGLAFHIESECPDSREKQTALTHLSIVMMANSAIVQKCPVNTREL